jgi:hypothetical protein
MAINIDKMRQKLDALNTKGGDKKLLFWKPQEGEQTIRIVPDADGDPFKEFWFHYGVADEVGFLCPKKNHGDSCSVCNFTSELYSTKDEEDRKVANQLRAKQRFFSPVVVRSEEAEGVRLWGYSKTVYESLLNYVLNPDYGDITDPESGTDLVVSYGKKAGQMFPTTDVLPRRRPSPLSNDTSKARDWMETKLPYDTLFASKSPEEVEEIFRKHRDGVSDSEKTETVAYNGKSTDEVGDAFNELLAS